MGVYGVEGSGPGLHWLLMPTYMSTTVRSALRMLEGRTSREAQEFVKKLKELEKCMEADL